MTVDYGKDFYPEPFPSNLPTLNLERIDLAKLLNNDQNEAQRLFGACTTQGFCYLDLTTHPTGIKLMESAQQVHQVGKVACANTSIGEKREFKTRPPESGSLDTGYKETGCDENGQPNKVEMINISQAGLFSGTEDYKLPPFLAKHETLFRSILTEANAVQNVILSILEKQLQMPTGTLTSIHKLSQISGDFVRILNYPAPKDGNPLPEPPTSPHRDAVSVALLFTWQGGLQITDATNEDKKSDTALESESSWYYVPPVAGHVIMNLGDALTIFTNGLLCSGKHRVVTPPGDQSKFDRISVLLVARPDWSTPMRSLKSPLIPPGEYLEGETVRAKEWAAEKVLRVIRLMEKAKS